MGVFYFIPLETLIFEDYAYQYSTLMMTVPVFRLPNETSTFYSVKIFILIIIQFNINIIK